MMCSSLTIILSLLPLTLGYPNCTAKRLQKDVELELDDRTFNKANLEKNQEYFRENCSDSCVNVDINGIMRRRCSNESSDGSGFAVYQCPNNAKLFYLMNQRNCRIKYYTLCDENASHKDNNLTQTLKDLLCSCDTEQLHLKHYVGNTSCTILFNETEFLYCKEDSKRYIKYVEACVFGTCADRMDVDQNRFNCEGNHKGLYCKTETDGTERFFRSHFKCDGEKHCYDSLDEKGCNETSGVYCDADGAKVDYKPEKDVCDGAKECPNGADESEAKCEENYCIAHNGSSIFMTKDILCNGITDCKDAKDEQEASCSKVFLNLDGAPCDNNTKWIRQRYLCSEGLCEDGMDMSERWNCSQHEYCPDPEADDPLADDALKILCNSTIFCTASDKANAVMHGNCRLCEKGAASSFKRCKDSGKGITCMKEAILPPHIPTDIFVPDAEVCDGKIDCKDGEDEDSCPGGYYCTNQIGKTFIPWQKVCTGALMEAACDDKSDQAHCDSNFFDILIFKDRANWNGNYSEYLNITLIFNKTADQIERDTLRRVVKHRAFACQEYFYNLEGPKGAIIKKTIEELCIDEGRFNCSRPYKTHFLNNGTLNRKIMKKWLCQYPDYCGSHGSDTKPQIELCRNSSYCYTHEMRCNNKTDCTEYTLVDKVDNKGEEYKEYEEIADKTDEIGCSDKGLKCGPNSTVIEDAYVCDGFKDCETEVDEKICDGNSQLAKHLQRKRTSKVASYNQSFHRTENSVDVCPNIRKERYLLYSQYTLDISSDTYSLSQIYENVTESCDCDQLTGARYMAAVCSTKPNATGQPCTNSQYHNNLLCYPELKAEWYTEDFNKSVDVSCKTQTKTLSRTEVIGGAIHYRTFVRYHNNSLEFVDKSVFCKNPSKRKDKKCGIPLTKMCDLINDCGDWSDESSTYCRNNFECKTGASDNVTRVIANSKKCNGASDCDRSQDECLDECNEDGITNTVSLLGGVGLLVVVWIFGVVSLIFNVYLIITMTKSAFDVLKKVPHRFIYRILVTTIAIGDVMVSVYLVMLASVDSFRDGKYCEMKEQWLTGSACITMGVLSTFGNHVSLFAMVTLSLFRLKTVVNYLWPRSVNQAKAIQITIVLVLAILVGAVLISTIPLVDSLKDSFVDRYYFPRRGNVFERGEKRHIYHTMKTYNEVGKFLNPNISNLTQDSSWDDLLDGAEFLFNGSVLITGKKPYSFYSAYGVCLFNYLNSTKNNSFAYVISIIALNLVCFLTIIASYLFIWKVGTKSKSTERQLQKKLSIAVFLNILCRLPLFMICLAHSIERFDDTASVSENCTGTCLYYRYMSVFVIPINSVINPFINSEADLLDMIGGKCFGKRQNMITTGKTITNSVTVGGTSLTTVSVANRSPGYKLSKVDPPSTLEEETTN